MRYFSIPACYFPSTALFLDDSRDFLLNFVLQLDEGVAYKIFDAPRDALNYIHNKVSNLTLLNTDFRKNAHTPQTAISTTKPALYAEVYNPHRFSEISVVVVDYAMPGMNGLEFCRRLENANIKKILLTGQADEKLAIDAFNQGLIHRYIKKSNVNAAELITQSIHELQLQYFQDLSDNIGRTRSTKMPACLQDKKFAHFFQQLCEEKKIIEYYSLDQSGSFFMLDDDANVSYLFVKTEHDLNQLSEWARENTASTELIKQLSVGEKIPTLWQDLTDKPAWDEWRASLAPAKQLIADENYYYTYMQGNELFNVRQHKILSYQRYLEELDAQELLIG